MANRKRKTDKRAKKMAEGRGKSVSVQEIVEFTTPEDGKVTPTSTPLNPDTTIDR